MPLTPEDVANKQFTSTRLKPGYDETEVDEFLDEVEAELTRLYRENDELRTKLAAAQRSATEAAQRSATEAGDGRPVQQAVQPAAPEPAPPAPAPVQRATAPAGNPAEAATGILALAQRTAEEHVAEARSQAERVVSEARSRADQLQREMDDRHRQMMGSLETERAALEHRVQELRSFEHEYRARLKAYLENQLRELETRDSAAPQGHPGGQQQPSQQGTQVSHLPSAGGPSRQHGQPPQPSGRSPFVAGAPLGHRRGEDAPSAPPQQATRGFGLEEGPDSSDNR
jgi:DivIVA domain-containing protein